MENPTSFNLNQAFDSWRERLKQSPCFRSENVAELESHLRDAVAAWEGRGLTEEEAFLLAVRRLGSPAETEGEFAKINRGHVWLYRLLWMLIGIQLYGLIGTVSRTISDFAVLGGMASIGYDFQHDRNAAAWFSAHTALAAALVGLANLLTLAATIAGLWLLVRRKECSLRIAAAKVLRRPVLAAIAICLALLLLAVGSIASPWLLSHYYGPSTMGGVAYSCSLARFVLNLGQVAALASVTVLLLRKRVLQAATQ